MRQTVRILVFLAGSLALLGTAGCVSQTDIDSLRRDVNAAQTTADAAMARADAAYNLATQANDGRREGRAHLYGIAAQVVPPIWGNGAAPAVFSG